MEFLQIFTQMSWIVAILFVVGLVFMIAEVFVPGFGFFGITGVLLSIAGVVVRIVQGLNLTQSLALILVVLGVYFVLVIVMVFSAKYGILGKTGLFENESTLSYSYNKPDKDLRHLVGKSGKTITNLSLAGKAKIRGKIYDVMSINSYIESNKHIKVVEVKDNVLMVRKWFE